MGMVSALQYGWNCGRDFKRKSVRLEQPALRFDEDTLVWYVGPQDTVSLVAESAIDTLGADWDADSPQWEPPDCIRNLLPDAYRDICSYATQLDLPQPAIVLLPDDDSDCVGRFVHGTEGQVPLLCVYPDRMERELVLAPSGAFAEELNRTLRHELGHAYIYSVLPDITPDDRSDADEDICEDFARNCDVAELKEAVARLVEGEGIGV